MVDSLVLVLREWYIAQVSIVVLIQAKYNLFVAPVDTYLSIEYLD